MFETTPSPQAPLPPMPSNPPQFGGMPGMTPPSGPGMVPGPAQPKVFTMPEKFRAGNGGGSGPSRGGTKKLVIILVVVVVVAGLGIGGLYLFQNVFNKSSNDNLNAVTNTTVTNSNENTNSSNSNSNENTNSDTNGNLNSNENTNTETNINSVTNSNSNSNANTNSSLTTPGPLPSSADADADGLTDVEEAVYGTDAAKPDTDGDGFIDGKQVRTDGTIIGEFYNGYNPKGTGRLEDSTLVKRQENSTKEYSILAPATWTAVVDSSGGIIISPSQETTEFFQTRIYDNTAAQTPKEWYKSVSPSTDVSTLKTTTVNGLEGIYSEDEGTVYLFKGTKVYGITYNTGSVTQANYRTTFDMMVLSFRLVSAS